MEWSLRSELYGGGDASTFFGEEQQEDIEFLEPARSVVIEFLEPADNDKKFGVSEVWIMRPKMGFN